MKSIYNYIFTLFLVGAIFQRKLISSPTKFNKIIIFLNAVIAVSEILSTASFTMQKKNVIFLFLPVMLSAIISAMFRLHLIFKINQMNIVVENLNEFIFSKKGGDSKKLKIILLISTSIQIVILIFKLFIKKNYYDMSLFLYGYSFQNKMYNDIASMVYEFFFLLFVTLPFICFSFYYIAICCNLRQIIRDFAQILSEQSVYEYNILMHFYSSIKSIARRIDEEFGPLVFMVTMNNTLGISSSLYLMLHPELFDDFLAQLTVYTIFFTNFFLFLAMITSASMVAEASSAVGPKALLMPENKKISTLTQQKFLMCAEKEIVMTVWKIIPIRRKFSFSIIGAIFTYAMIFYSLSGMQC